MDCSPPGSSVHGILQARTLEWVAMSTLKITIFGLIRRSETKPKKEEMKKEGEEETGFLENTCMALYGGRFFLKSKQ